ncbi:MAG: hypothetical protein ACP5HK_05775 [Acidilobus sp.]
MPRAKLTWFVVRTRLSRGLLIITLVMVAYGALAAVSLYSSQARIPPGLVRTERELAVVYSALLLFLLSMQGGVVVLKSDRDYLFTLPVGRGELAASLYVAQLMLSGVWTLVMLSWYLPFVQVPAEFAVPYMVLFVVLLTSLNVSVAELEARPRALVSALMAAWDLSAIAGLPYSPGATFMGMYLPGTLTTALLSVGLTAYVIRARLSRAPLLYSFPTPGRGAEGWSGAHVSFAGASGLRALVRMKLNNIVLSGRIGGVGAGGSRFVYRRFSLRKYMAYLAASALALLAAAAAASRLLAAHHIPVAAFGPTLLMVSGMALVAVINSLTMMSLAFERPWLAFTATRASDYLRATVLVQALLNLLSLLPFSVAFALMPLVGLWQALDLLPQLLVAAPAFTVIYMALSAHIIAIPQLRTEGFMPGQAGARGLLYTFLLLVQVGLIAASLTSMRLSVYSSIAIVIVAAALLTPSGHWERAAQRMVEAGYV